MKRAIINPMLDTAGLSAVTAHYIPAELAEYRGNPLIEALPPIVSPRRLAVTLPERPTYSDEERNLPRHLRAHCALRLLNYFEPLGRHYDVASRFDLLMRSGYRQRNPKTAAFHRRLQEIYRSCQGNDLTGLQLETQPQAMSMSLIGVSGTGKTRSINRALAQYPKAIFHRSSGILQIPWVIVECPHDGSVKQLCLGFFKTIDNILGSNYAERFGGRGVTTEQRLLEVVQIARIHAVGIIVFDELQHIQPAGQAGIAKMLNFFVTLVNLSESPIVLVGTMAAQHLLQADFRQARRGAGFGSMVWPRFEKDREWDYLMKSMWKYQWTQKTTPFDEHIGTLLYDRTQGVVDLAVKLYLLSQYRAMATRAEEVTVALMQQVADEDFQLLRPMLNALRSGDPKKIANFDDLRPLNFETLLARENLCMTEPVDACALRQAAEQDEAVRRQQTLDALVAIGTSEIMANLAVTTVFNDNPDSTPPDAMKKALDLLKPAKPKMGIKPPKRSDTPRDENDLRQIGEPGQRKHQAFKEAGLVRAVGE